MRWTITIALAGSVMLNLAVFLGLLEMTWKLFVLWRSGENGITGAMFQERLALALKWVWNIIIGVQGLSMPGMNSTISTVRLIMLIFNLIVTGYLLVVMLILRGKLNDGIN